MKKFLKGMVMVLALVLVVTPCAVLFAGCAVEEYISEDILIYTTNLEYDDYATDEDYQLVEEVKEEGVTIGRIYRELNTENTSQKRKVVIVDGDTLECYEIIYYKEGPSEINTTIKVVFSYEKYNNMYINYYTNQENYYCTVIEIKDGKLIGMMTLDVSTMEEAKAEVDAYKESGKSFVVYFKRNHLSF